MCCVLYRRISLFQAFLRPETLAVTVFSSYKRLARITCAAVVPVSAPRTAVTRLGLQSMPGGPCLLSLMLCSVFDACISSQAVYLFAPSVKRLAYGRYCPWRWYWFSPVFASCVYQLHQLRCLAVMFVVPHVT